MTEHSNHINRGVVVCSKNEMLLFRMNHKVMLNDARVTAIEKVIVFLVMLFFSSYKMFL